MGLTSKIYSSVISLRNYAFDKNLIKSTKFNKPVISVGNISMGGTGKTPMVAYLVDLLTESNLKVGVVSRGYGGQYTGVQKVKPNKVKTYGDEMSMLAERYPLTPIYVCKKRVLAIEKLINSEDIDIIVADDGFQHRYFERDLDIVLVDSTDKKRKIFPAGRLREPMEGLKRADIVVITRAKEIIFDNLYKKINEYIPKENIFFSKTSVEGLRSFDNTPLESLGDKEIVLVSGIGSPKSFERTVKNQSLAFKDHLVYRDHFSFDQSIINEIEKKYPEAVFLCTEKDFVKIKHLKLSNDYYYLKIKTEILGNKNELDAKVRNLST